MLVSLVLAASISTSLLTETLPLSNEEAFSASFMRNGTIAHIRFDMPPEYYLYEYAFAIKTAEGEELRHTYGQAGDPHEDEFLGVKKVFWNSVDVFVYGVGNTDAITIQYQGCKDKEVCYPPSALSFDTN